MLFICLFLADLLRDLSHDDIEVRQAAAAELYRRGAELRKELSDARRDASDIETRSRLDDILRRLDVDERIRGFGGGPRVADFGLSLRIDRFAGRGPFRLAIEVMNVGSAEREFPGIALWDLEEPDQETRTPGAEARVTVKKFIGGGLRRTRWGRAPGVPVAAVALRPGESTTFDFLLEAKDLAAGDYDVRVEIRIPEAEENLRSNVVRLMIRK
ncbi:MAG TPA: hypothetical protein VF950_15085 [Planctomycetota bacterium]